MTITLLRKSLTFTLSVLLGTGAAIAIAGTAPVRTISPAPKALPARTVPQGVPSDVIRLDPVLVTISSSRFTALRKELACDTAVAANPAAKSRV